MKKIVRCLCLLASSTVSAACDDPLKPLELVQDLRVLAARVEVDGEPERAAPLPGEGVRVRWLAVAPDRGLPFGWAFAACVASPSNAGIPSCAAPPFAEGASDAPSGSEPQLAFTVPDHVNPDVTPRILLLGSICAGAPEGDPLTSNCPLGVQGTRVSFDFDLAGQKDVNYNPAFSEPGLWFDGEPWLASNSTEAACEDGVHPLVRAGSGAHEIRISAALNSRDPLTPSNALDPLREHLIVSHFATEGSLDRAFSSIESEASTPETSVDWLAPREAPAAGVLVRFWAVLRDLRGGADFVERAVCLLP